MTITRRTFLATAAVVLPGVARAQRSPDGDTSSDPARVGKTGRPQLVEFFHPT